MRRPQEEKGRKERRKDATAPPAYTAAAGTLSLHLLSLLVAFAPRSVCLILCHPTQAPISLSPPPPSPPFPPQNHPRLFISSRHPRLLSPCPCLRACRGGIGCVSEEGRKWVGGWEDIPGLEGLAEVGEQGGFLLFVFLQLNEGERLLFQGCVDLTWRWVGWMGG